LLPGEILEVSLDCFVAALLAMTKFKVGE